MIATVLLLVMATQGPGATVNVRGVGAMTCATALQAENRVASENWIAGYWAAWDMARIGKAAPLAPTSDLNGIVAEVERECRSAPSHSLVMATMAARVAVQARSKRAR